jgi:single-stranded-DNA-specific exonuclease
MSVLKKWNFKERHLDLAKSLSSELNISPIVTELLIQRGFKSTSEINTFLYPQFEPLADVIKDMPDMDKAVQLLNDAITHQTKITVYGDYDVDGVSATVILVSALRDLGANAHFYIPHRLSGYSLNPESLKEIKDGGTEIIITVDNGISAYEEIAFANSLGMKVIVTDHHTVPEKLPDAACLINPRRIVPENSLANLCGAGTAFMLVAGLFLSKNKFGKENLKKYLDLVAVATVSDVVSLKKENRMLTILGLEQLNTAPRPGIAAILKVTKNKKKIDARGIGFGISPMINAAGRLDHAELAVQLLLSENSDEAMRWAHKISEVNMKRRTASENLIKEAESIIERDYKFPEDKVIVLANKEWHAGVVGIGCAQLTRKYLRPVVLIGAIGDEGRGSIRTVPGVNVMPALTECKDLLLTFGGHPEAAGFSIDFTKVEEFKKKFTQALQVSVNQEAILPKQDIDLSITLPEVTLELIKDLQKLHPLGKDNPLPIFAIENLTAVSHELVGDGTHLKMTLTDGMHEIAGIGFGLHETQPILETGKPFKVACSLELNQWNNKETAQLHVYDIQLINP